MQYIFFYGIQFHIVEIFFLTFSILFLIKKSSSIKLTAVIPIRTLLVLISLFFFLISIVLSLNNSISQLLVYSNLLKTFEIIFVAYIAFWICKLYHIKYVIFIVASLAVVNFSLALYDSFSFYLSTYNAYKSFRMLNGYWQLLILSISLPFVYRKSFHIISRTAGLLSILSLSRGVWLSLFFILLANRFFNKNYTFTISRLLIPLLILIFIAFLFHDVLLDRISKITDLEHRSNIIRLEMIYTAFQLFIQHPMFGIGAGNFELFIDSDYKNMGVFNIHLQILAEQGIFGFLSFTSLLFLLYYSIQSGLSMCSIALRPFALSLFFIFIVFFVYISLGFLSGEMRFIFGLIIGSTLFLNTSCINKDING